MMPFVCGANDIFQIAEHKACFPPSLIPLVGISFCVKSRNAYQVRFLFLSIIVSICHYFDMTMS